MENLFFLKSLQTLTREVTVSDPQKYDLCTKWSEDDPPVCLESIPAIRPSNVRTEEIEYQAYVIDAVYKEAYKNPTEPTYEGFDDDGNPIELEEPQYLSFEMLNRDVDLPIEILPENCVVVGTHGGKDIIHVLVDKFTAVRMMQDPDYISSTYKGMAAVSQDIHDAVHETTFEASEQDPESKKMVTVTRRIKTSAYKAILTATVKKSESIPHEWAGAPKP